MCSIVSILFLCYLHITHALHTHTTFFFIIITTEEEEMNNKKKIKNKKKNKIKKKDYNIINMGTQPRESIGDY